MKTLIGIGLIILGIGLGLYVGLYLCFIGGIVAIVEAIKATPIESLGIAFGIVRIVFAALLGWLVGFLPLVFGLGVLKSK